jgi:hypothetical protein
MNERIAKLANECGFDVDKTGTFGNYSEMHRLEKFAELLIKECAYVATINSNQWHSAGSFVLTHFGIEK